MMENQRRLTVEMNEKVEMDGIETGKKVEIDGGGDITGRWIKNLEGEIFGKQANEYEALQFN